MSKRLQKQIAQLNEKLLGLGILVENRVNQAVNALKSRDLNLAKMIIEADVDVDTIEVEIEEDSLKLLALYQPVADNLRAVVATIKINNDLERIGDEAVNIARRTLIILKYPPITFPLNIWNMSEKVRRMLRLSIDSLVMQDVDIAYKVRIMDHEVDRLNGENYDIIKDALNTCEYGSEILVNLLFVSRHLERIADHATNIAEEVIHLLEGEISRHKDI